MSASAHTESNIAKLIFNATAWANIADNAASSPLTNIAVSLQTADPGAAGNMSTNEAAYTSYARVNVARTSGGWTVAGSGPTTVNPAAQINFPAGTGGGETVTNFATGYTGGGAVDYLVAGTVSPSIVTGNGITPFLTTATTITLT